MYRIIIILVSILLLLNCCFHTPDQICAKAEIMNRLRGDTLIDNKGIFYSIRIQLINNTDTAFHYWTMSCSWESNWIFDSDLIKFFVACPKNYPLIKHIYPNQKEVRDGIIEVMDSTKSIDNIKIGFVLVNKNEITDESDFVTLLWDKIKAQKNIIWSKSFKIKE